MTQDELNKILDLDPYQQDRKKPTESEIRLYLREVNYHCPLCGKELQNRKQVKSNKLFEIAHIYPNRPTIEQYEELHDLERLGNDSESFENKIALCKDCHDTQDYHTTKDDYLKLLQIKKGFLLSTALNDSTASLGLEDEILLVIQKLPSLEHELADLKYDPIAITNKFTQQESLLKHHISGYILSLYPYIRECFRQLDGKNGFVYNVLAQQIHGCFLKMSNLTSDKEKIFNHIVSWIKEKTCSTSVTACEAVVAFFVQNCEVFNEVSE